MNDRTQNVKDASYQSSPGPKVLAAGLWRCGTSSLTLAFEEHFAQPYKPAMHGSVTFYEEATRYLKLGVMAQEEPDKQARQALLRQLFDGFNASSDWPGMAFVDDLVEMYPDVKIILNKRSSPEVWAKSAKDSLSLYSTWIFIVIAWMFPLSRWHWRMYQGYKRRARRRFGSDTDIWSTEFYERHNQWVRDVAAAHNKPLLEWDPSMGWQPLCEFLGQPVPAVAFPRTHDARVMTIKKIRFVGRGILSWILVVALAMLIKQYAG